MSRPVFASPAWVALLREQLEALLPEMATELAGATFSVCEIYTDVPTVVNPLSTVAVTWGVSAGALHFSETARDDVSLWVQAEWAGLAPLARTVVAGDPEREAELQREMRSLMRAGQMEARGPRSQPAFMARLHDLVAARTG